MNDDIGTASDEEADHDASDNAGSQTTEDTSDDGPASHIIVGEVGESPRDSSDKDSREHAPEPSSNRSIEQYADVDSHHPAQLEHDVAPFRLARPWRYPGNGIAGGRRESVIACRAPHGSV